MISAGVPSPIDVNNVHNGDTFFVKVLTPGSVTVTATASTTVLSGRVFLRTGDGEQKQKLITASNTTTQATATATVSATNATTTTSTTTTTTVAPTTTTTIVPTTTTEIGSEGPTTTVAPTTTMVEVAGPTLPPDIQLPATGQPSGRTQSTLLLGTGLALMGFALILATRRREA
ncbi:MAG TPA: hypothetical protein PK020_11760 [Ilumatobacteraceae bacterium]|nr:hypothetical protein [Ilumatobacteraceae bacterium]HRB03654.1 hypothetical protein [Ilumatobacteraceae bacterium]